MSNHKLVSIIIPCRNEGKFIDRCLDSIINNDFPKDQIEVLVMDGMSVDGTREILNEYSKKHGFIRIINNPKIITSSALNIGIDHAKGEIIIIMGAHTIYPPNYIGGLVSWLEKSGADAVGGLILTYPAKEKPLARAIALVLSHPFGVGNAYFRIGSKLPRSVDTVPFGCYRREVFDRIGIFDEELVRNQDDEFNLRLKKHGGRILLVPEIVSYYYARDSLTKLWRMYYQYGYFKPLVAKKVGGILTLRQIVPAMFIACILLTAILGLWIPLMKIVFAIIAGSYLTLDAYFSGKVALDKGIKIGLALALVFPLIHISYGVGYLKGIHDFWIRTKKNSRKYSAIIPTNR